MTTTQYGQLSAAGPTVQYDTFATFDTKHRLLSVDGPRTDESDVTTYAYFADADTTVNRRGRLHTVTDALSHTSTFDDYDTYGTAKTVTDANGVVTTRITDARGRTTSTTNKAVTGDSNESTDYVSSQTIDARDRITDTTSPRGLVTRYGYEDGTNRLTDTTLVDTTLNERER